MKVFIVSATLANAERDVEGKRRRTAIAKFFTRLDAEAHMRKLDRTWVQAAVDEVDEALADQHPAHHEALRDQTLR